MIEVKRYDLGACYAHMYGLDVVECAEGDFVLASDYDRDTKALEDKARNQHARDSVELRDLCSQRDGLKAELWRVKEERDSQQRIAIAAMAELAELKAKCGSVFLEYKPLPELMMASYHEVKGWNACLDEATRLRAIVAALQAECKGLENEVNKLERNLAAAPSREGEV